MRSQQQFFGKFAKLLHWSIALGIFINFIIGITLDENSWYNFHKQLGIAVLSLAVLRILWRIISNYPAPLASLSRFEKIAAHSIQGILYLLCIALPVSGYLMVNAYSSRPLIFLGMSLPHLLQPQSAAILTTLAHYHTLLAFSVVGLAILHGLAALAHHFIKKDQVLLRMLPFKYKQD